MAHVMFHVLFHLILLLNPYRPFVRPGTSPTWLSHGSWPPCTEEELHEAHYSGHRIWS